MKKSIPLFVLILLILTSCNQSFYNTRHHAHRDYVKMGPPPRNENQLVSKENNKKVEIKTIQQKQISLFNVPSVKEKKSEVYHSPKKLNNVVVKSPKKPNHIVKTKAAKKEHYQKHKTKKTKEVNASPILNIFSLVLGIIGMVSFFVMGIILLFSLLDVALLITGMTMLYFCLIVALLAIILGVLGLSLKHPSQGLGIAGIIMGGIILLSILLILILIAVI